MIAVPPFLYQSYFIYGNSKNGNSKNALPSLVVRVKSDVAYKGSFTCLGETRFRIVHFYLSFIFVNTICFASPLTSLTILYWGFFSSLQCFYYSLLLFPLIIILTKFEASVSAYLSQIYIYIFDLANLEFKNSLIDYLVKLFLLCPESQIP